jgi:hypothetical protein
MKITNYYKTILNLIIEKSLGPTFAARTLFIYSSILYNGYGYIETIKNTDNFNNVTKLELELEDKEKYYYISHIGLLGISLLNSTFNSKTLYEFIVEQSDILLGDKDYIAFKDKFSKEIVQIENELNQYYILREQDGWKDSNEQISLPNGKFEVIPNEEQDFSKIDIAKWCPLQGQKMLGAKWGHVKGLIPQKIFEQLENCVIIENSKIDFTKEYLDVLELSKNLTDEQKMLAEFWAGIGGSITPPGFFNYFLICYCENNKIDYYQQILFLHMLNCGLFQASIIIWSTKYKMLEARPIQVIRGLNMYEEIDYYFGESNTNLWLPYQEKRLITPPFPDCPSGHSTFSSTAATILTSLLGSNLEDLNIIMPGQELYKLSPIFPRDYDVNCNLTNIKIPMNCSKIQQNIPTTPINMIFKNWEELAQSAGVSRLYGGIHHKSSNKIGLDLGKEIGKLIVEMFSIQCEHL